MMLDKTLYSTHRVRCIITGVFECGKRLFLTDLRLNIINEFEKIYIYSPSLIQGFYQKRFKRFINYMPIDIIRNILNEKYIDLVFAEIVNAEEFEKSVTEIETYQIIKKNKISKKHERRGIIILNDLN